MIWTLIGLYLAVIVLLQLQPVQGFIGSRVANAISQKLGTKVAVGKVNPGFFNRLIIDDVLLFDQQNDTLLTASRISVNIDLIPLTEGRISISSAQLFGMHAHLSKATADAKPNFQFVLDSLASKDQTAHTPLNLHIGSLIIRNGHLTFDQKDAPKNEVFKHISLNDISTHIILNKLTDDEVLASIRKLSFRGWNDLSINKLTLKALMNDHEAKISDFELSMPHTELTLGDLLATYKLNRPKDKDHMSLGDINLHSLQFSGSIQNSIITLSDLGSLFKDLQNYRSPLYLNTVFSGTSTTLRISDLNIRAGNGDINLQAKAQLSDLDSIPRWSTTVQNMNLSGAGIKRFAANMGQRLSIPKEIIRLGTINFHGNAKGRGADVQAKGVLSTDAGKANLLLVKQDRNFKGSVDTQGFNLKRLLENNQFGTVAANLNFSGTLPDSKHPKALAINADGKISRFDFNKYSYRNLTLNGSYAGNLIKGIASIDDPNIKIKAQGNYNLLSKLYDVKGTIDKYYDIEDVNLDASNQGKDSHLSVTSPYADLHLDGKLDYATLPQSFANLVRSKLPTLPGLPKTKATANNDFVFEGTVVDTRLLKKYLNINLNANEPISLQGMMSDKQKKIQLTATLPDFAYNGKNFEKGFVNITTPNDTLMADVHLKEKNGPLYEVNAKAADNKLSTLVYYNNYSKKLPVIGKLDAETQFFTNEENQDAAHISVHPSIIFVGDSIWNVEPADIIYSKNNLLFDHFEIAHNKQHIIVSGLATSNRQDSLMVELKDIDVNYVLNLVNFHAVDFGGKASGKAYLYKIFSDPDGWANLKVKDFTFENGEMGDLTANVSYNLDLKRIIVDAKADDGPGRQTEISGFIAPADNDIRLDIDANGTPMYFLQNYTSSFASNIEGKIHGKVAVIGPLSDINLVGNAWAEGSCHILPTNTDYTFDHAVAVATPNKIVLKNDTVYDRNHNIGIVDLKLTHESFSNMNYDLNIEAKNLLSFDQPTFGNEIYCGTVYASGNCRIRSVPGGNIIDINGTPEKNSVFAYNAASPAAVSNQNFIHWRDITTSMEKNIEIGDTIDFEHEEVPAPINISSDMHINFLVNANQNLAVKVVMDNTSGDAITLNGDGVIRANYFNKGPFEMYGNYNVDHGIYDLTIQNVIKKRFLFEQGGKITFGGDPMVAPLNLKAKYTVNGVSLSDLNIGKSFSNNNIRVDCFMNITGNPNTPKVDFSFDLPTVNADAKQMVYSLVNSEEEMNQQVLYLLAIGRFMAQTNNNQKDDPTQQSQTSLAMQSILSGTISQQLNNLLSSVSKSSDWNFGANISTGNEGFNNAEYEGLLSGRLFNNRLIFNGQFGYRDNQNATTSFIGDFDLRYLIFPNGNFALRMYNQTNDRYFIKNTMNTQGIGIILKKDFNGWRDLLGIRRKEKE